LRAETKKRQPVPPPSTQRNFRNSLGENAKAMLRRRFRSGRRPMLKPVSRAERLRHYAMRLFNLSELVDQPSRSHNRVEALIDEGETIADGIRREFR
jgi:hypothetical protein